MGLIKKSTNNKCWRGCGEKGPLLLQGNVHGAATVWRFLKLKTELPNDPAISLRGVYPERNMA